MVLVDGVAVPPVEAPGAAEAARSGPAAAKPTAAPTSSRATAPTPTNIRRTTLRSLTAYHPSPHNFDRRWPMNDIGAFPHVCQDIANGWAHGMRQRFDISRYIGLYAPKERRVKEMGACQRSSHRSHMRNRASFYACVVASPISLYTSFAATTGLT